MLLKRNALIAALSATTLFPSIAAGGEDMSAQEIKVGYKKHAALTQLRRWYLLYEEPTYGIDNQLDILTKDVRLKSGLGEAKGHDQYVERVKQIPTTWKNAHQVKTTDIALADDGSVTMIVNITYLNQGALPDGKVRSADLTYTTVLQPTETVLPKFSSIEIAQNSDTTVDEFVSAYGHNRLLSLVHYWLALIEDPKRDPEPVREILADDFSLNFSSGSITNFDSFKSWLAGPGSQVVASTHKISNFKYDNVGNNTYKLSMAHCQVNRVSEPGEMR